MRIYVGTIYTDLVLAPRDTLPIFENLFANKTGSEYSDCWDLIIDNSVICLTHDSVKAAPDDATIVRIGRSVRKSDFGQIIETEMTLPEYLFLDDTPIDRRQNF